MPLDSLALARRGTADIDERDALGILGRVLTKAGPGRIALVSSFGAESVALLHLVARVDAATPVLFLETGMLFAETVDYQRSVAAMLGLTDMRVIRPAGGDANGTLHRSDPDGCCALRKVAPLERALQGFDGWITGRKRFHGGRRRTLPVLERDAAGRLKINPLAAWSAAEVADYIGRHALPRHPLVARGYGSIGCEPCTTRASAGEGARAGRWRGTVKEECGIHLVAGKIVRASGKDAA